MTFLHDAILTYLPKAGINTQPTDTTSYDGPLQYAWKQDGIIAFHMQDDRLTEEERCVLVHIALRVRGGRVV